MKMDSIHTHLADVFSTFRSRALGAKDPPRAYGHTRRARIDWDLRWEERRSAARRHPSTIYWRSRDPYRIQKLIDHRTSRIAFLFIFSGSCCIKKELFFFYSISRNVKKNLKINRRRRSLKNASALGCPGDDRRPAGFNQTNSIRYSSETCVARCWQRSQLIYIYIEYVRNMIGKYRTSV